MKKNFSVFFLFLFAGISVFAQVSINSDNSAPDNSAMLEVKSTIKGLLPPRMTTSQMNSILLPSEGLLVYNTTLNSLFWFNGSVWKRFSETITETDPVFTVHPASGITAGNITNWNAAFTNRLTLATGSAPLTLSLSNTQLTGSIAAANSSTNGYLKSTDWNIFNNKVSSQWVTNGQDITYSAGKVGIGTTAPVTSAALEVKSTSQGFLPPRMSMAQRDAISSPVDGLMIYCMDCVSPNNVQVYSNGTWFPMAFNRFPYVTSVSEIGSPWVNYVLTGVYTYSDADNDPQGISLFKWYRADDITGLNEVMIPSATGQSYTLTTSDLTKYIRFSVKPVAQTGASPGIEVKSATYIGPIITWACGVPLTINHVAGTIAPVSKTVLYNSVTSIPGEPTKCWITSNLGADHEATAFNDGTEASAGWYWQFNRQQGFKHDGVSRTPNTTWITSISENSDWITVNDPCALELGNGWRIPTKTEWTNVDASGGWVNWTLPYNSGLKLHAAGVLPSADGSLILRGTNGSYWSSTQSDAANSWYLSFNNVDCAMYSNLKAIGLTLRCLRE